MNNEDELRMDECLNPRLITMPGAFLIHALPNLEEIPEADGAFGACTRHDATSTFTQTSISRTSIIDFPGRAEAVSEGPVEQTLSAMLEEDAAMYGRTARTTEVRDAEKYGITSISLRDGVWLFNIFWHHESDQSAVPCLIELMLRLHEDNVRLSGDNVTVCEVNRLLAVIPEHLRRKHGLPAYISAFDRRHFSQMLSEDLESYIVPPDAWFKLSLIGKDDLSRTLQFHWSCTTGAEIGPCGQQLIDLLLSQHGAGEALAWARQRESSGNEPLPEEWLSPLGEELLLGTWQRDLASLVRHSSLPLQNASRQVARMATGLEASDLRYFRFR